MACLFFFSAPAQPGWGTCLVCHNGVIAPGKDALKEKHKTLEAFVKAALASIRRMMKHIQKDAKSIRETGTEIGLK